jgi:hypothetical protein
VTTAPGHADANGVPVQCVPGLSGGAPDLNAAALSGHAVVHFMAGSRLRFTTAGRRISSRRVKAPFSTTPWTSGRPCSGTTTT